MEQVTPSLAASTRLRLIPRVVVLGATVVAVLAQKAGIEKRVHAHALRHAYAVELEREGAIISTIRDLLGHSSASVTDRYLRRLGAGEAVEFSRQRSWTLS